MLTDRKGERYENRRERVAIQVLSRFGGDSIDTDEKHDAAMVVVRIAADMTFTATINDLDWEAAALKRLREANWK